MKTNKAYKFRIYPTEPQIKQLAVEFGNARFVWNHALGMRKKTYSRRKENMNYISLSKHVTQLKRTTRYHWLKQSTAGVLLKLPKLGEINLKWSQYPEGTPKMATVSKTPSGI